MTKKLASLFILSLLALPSKAQFLFEYNDDLPVLLGTDSLTIAWGGGLNYTQFSDFDFDFDGDLDLFAFDRSTNNLRVFTQEGSGADTHYEFSYDAKSLFPADLRYRATMVDYDNDGRKDLFTYGIGGMKVYRNVGSLGAGLQWELITDLIYSQYVSTYSNLYVSSSDTPAIIDVDGDGDIDILTFHQGGEHLEYHQNQSMDLYGVPDSLIFELKNECWGKFKEDFSTSAILLNDPDAPCVGGGITNPERSAFNREKSGAHAGSSVLALDIDNSGVLDLVIGDVSYPSLTLLINGGTAVNTDSPMISMDIAFPSNTTPANLQLFPAAYFLDVDFDGVKDLIVSCGAKNISQNVKSILYYKNLGSNALPNFVFMSDNFLQSEMIEVGLGSVPVIVDINEDGLDDLIVSEAFRYKPILDNECALTYYQNTGTASDPVFSFIDDNYLDLPLQNFGLRSIPTFGDIDNDGDQDMFLGVEDGSLVYYENFSIGSGAIYTTYIQNYLDNAGAPISTDNFCFPQLFDLDNDGLLDLVLGRKSGEIMYYRNIGTASVPSFELFNSLLGNFDTSGPNPDGFAAPHFIREDDTTYLFCGDYLGRMHYVTDIDANLSTGSDFFKETTNHMGIATQGYSSCFISDLNSNGKLEMYVGQDLGGLFRFEHVPNSTASLMGNLPEVSLAIYPNPTDGMITVSVNDGTAKHIELISMDGKRIIGLTVTHQKEQLDASDYPAGIYFVRVELQDGRIATRKVVKH